MKKKVGILTTLSLTLSKIVYGKQITIQNKYGALPDIMEQPLYGVPVDPPIQVMYGISPVEEAPSILDMLLKIGKIAIVPIILIIGIVAIIKIKKKKNKKDINVSESIDEK